MTLSDKDYQILEGLAHQIGTAYRVPYEAHADLAQDAALKLVQVCDQFDSTQCTWVAWMSTVARREMMNRAIQYMGVTTVGRSWWQQQATNMDRDAIVTLDEAMASGYHPVLARAKYAPTTLTVPLDTVNEHHASPEAPDVDPAGLVDCLRRISQTQYDDLATWFDIGLVDTHHWPSGMHDVLEFVRQHQGKQED